MTQAKLYVGDVREVLRSFPVRHFRTCVTSPPYWGLRSYGTPPVTWPDGWVGELGLEPTMEMYVAHIVEVFREVRRVLTDDGTVWLNLGDSYTDGGRGGNPGGTSTLQGSQCAQEESRRAKVRESSATKLKPKNLLMVPARVAIALQDDGWYLRSEIIWHKPNVMPESVRDRPTRSHEKLYLLSKQEVYFYDAVAIEEPRNQHERARRLREQVQGLDTVYDLKRDDAAHGQAAPGAAGAARSVKARQDLALKGTRNARDVWTISTSPAPIAHFACVDDETEALTLSGWKRQGELFDGDVIAAFDGGHLCWRPATFHRYPFSD